MSEPSQDFLDGMRDQLHDNVTPHGGMGSDIINALTFNVLNTDKSDDYYRGVEEAKRIQDDQDD